MATEPKMKATPAAKKEAPAADKPAADATPAKSEGAKSEGAKTEGAKSEGAKEAATTSYRRGEGQKAVTQAYKDNWNLIFGKKKKKKR